MHRRIRLVVAVLCVMAGSAGAATLTVDNLGDAADANPGDGMCATAGAVCTLRAAMAEANALAGADTIAFSINGTITIGSALPAITQALTIDGTTAVGFTGNPTLAIDGVSATFVGLDVNHAATTSTIKALIVMHFSIGIRVAAGSATVDTCWVGTDYGGSAAAANGDGVKLQTAGSIVENCTVSGNTGSGIVITGAGATNNIVRTSNIGTDWTGFGGSVPNARGVLIEAGATGNTIGGADVAANRIRTNVRCVVLDGASGNTISFNQIAACDEEGIVTLVDGPNIYSHNSIAFNGQLGIDAGNNGVTTTSFPVLTSVRDTGTSYNVRGTVNGTANTLYTIEVFGNGACDTSGFGEGAAYFSTANVTTNANGIGDFLVVAPRNSTTDITATATKSGGGTSEFSACMPPSTCALTIPDNTLIDASAGMFYAQPLMTTGGVGPITYEITAGTLPTGMMLGAANGVLAGTPQQTGFYSFTVKVTDADGCPYTAGFNLEVVCGTVGIAPMMLPALMFGMAYNAPLVGENGIPPYSFALASGQLPAGINLVGGALTGTPTQLGDTSFTVQVTDANDCTGTRQYSTAVGCSISSFEPPTLPPGEVGVLYRGFIQTRGGLEPYVYELTGSLPLGVTFDAATGVLIGTPSAPGTYLFTITSTDGGGCVATQDYAVTISGDAESGCCSTGSDLRPSLLLALLVLGLTSRRRRRA